MFKNKLIKFIYLIFICLLVGQVSLTSRRATDGDQLAQLNTVLNNLVSENENLRSQIYALTSMDNIQKYAQETHMVSATIANLGSVSVASRLGQP